MVRSLFAVSLLILLSACARGHGGPHAGSRWDGRRGYDGRGDYGYDLDASRAEAAVYRARAARSYHVPGPLEDPWDPTNAKPRSAMRRCRSVGSANRIKPRPPRWSAHGSGAAFE